ncbi:MULTISPECIES: LacI family DNA-binding transcriptional regulator [unclassified Rhodococcus (in: high G+C Gram-positive bacteria)]|uniref:LacI family DNA-binding transcriptional regulator n=2 Tax=Rhodococcus TaxID=1827 RepID=UPI000488A3C5|nr:MULTISPECIES: LacI family DNA-binding transcriptional regulator [unclassified Rhodococcus (in: high G+C Gram-positive bacteria)]KQU41421.1 LacI family transcriptional regulator [Rhodococcus sp. Leaf258]MBY6678015.1 LacI family DNA-binding transcriptional regulator [Rhodococcus sp. BP-332]MBY6681816.1 LacI family DNA-binding transcriptional regulator [Rhodococcus sp. BP-316]MBY6683945.1 LacI family DNA-binding transcriptional regulator [Rhodococcus sp. BP-288]MBY6693394.1 LacI family DNA-bin
MGHRYKVREIAQQSGLSEATVDRVLHERPGVREDTRAEVRQAIADLDKQRTQLRLSGRKFFVDVVMQAPERFCSQVRSALEAELPMLSPAVVRSRFHFRETESVPAMLETLDGIRARGSHGLIVKAPDDPQVSDALDAVVAAGIPVVTYVSDVPSSARTAYVGIDDGAAGATAAYLVDQWLGESTSSVLVTLSHDTFRNEGEREIGFRRALRRTASGVPRAVFDIARSSGLDDTVEDLVVEALTQHPDIEAVYSIGGGNVATVRAFERVGRRCRVFIAHDLDADNRRLLAERSISAVLHHDLRADARSACRLLMQAAGALDGVRDEPSPVHVVTPHNTPR